MTNVKRGSLIKVDTALNSMRDSGFDLSTAVGEPVDNSIQAGAKNIKIYTGFSADDKNQTQKIDEVAFADDGIGIKSDDLPNVLTLGFSTRYDERDGLGRFGVGMKLAGISHGKRIDVYTKYKGDNAIYHVYIDLDMIINEQQEFIDLNVVKDFPAKYKNLMIDEKGQEFKSGTLIVWSKIDRLNNGGRYGTSLNYKISELTKFLGRAYRYYIDNGIKIELDGKRIFATDPLFLLENPLSTKLIGKDVRASVIDSKKISIEGSEVEFTVTLLPVEVRFVQGEGGVKGSAARFKPLNIDENEGRISIIRNGREIYYDVIPRVLPGGVDNVDRFIGIELKFSAELDEYFSVRHVKRGAEPIDKLKQELRIFLDRPVKLARRKIRETWGETAKEENKNKKPHEDATNAAKDADKSMPKGIAGIDKDPNEVKNILENALQDLGINPTEEPELAQQKMKEFQELPITIIDAEWPGKSLMDIDHLNGKAIVKINKRHVFMEKVYSLIKHIADSDPNSISPSDAVRNAQIVLSAIDILLMAYAKAENMHEDPETAYADLKEYWGIFTAAYVKELLKNKNMM